MLLGSVLWKCDFTIGSDDGTGSVIAPLGREIWQPLQRESAWAQDVELWKMGVITAIHLAIPCI